MPTTTTTYSFNKPVVGADEDDWGGYLNGNWDSVDDLLDGTTPVTGIDINSGTIDNVVIGGATPAAGTFTTLTANTSITGTLATAAQPNITSVGTLTSLTVSGDVSFGDNDKAIFGAGSDLEVYHDGANSRILENGTGFLAIGTNGGEISLRGDSFNDYMLKAEQNSAVTLYHNALPKLATTSTGVDITGTLTSDGMTVGGSDFANTTYTGSSVNLTGVYTGLTSDGGFAVNVRDSGYLQFSTSNTERMRIDSSGNVGIGTSSPNNKLTIEGSATLNPYYATYLANSYYDSAWKYAGNGVAWGIGNNFGGVTNGTTIAVASSNSSGSGAALTWNPAFNIDSSGNLLVGTATAFTSDVDKPKFGVASSDASFDSLSTDADEGCFENNGNAGITIVSAASSTGNIYFGRPSFSAIGRIIYNHTDEALIFGTNNNAERMRIDSSGNVGIGVVPSAWGNVNKVVQVNGGALTSNGLAHSRLSSNLYYDATGTSKSLDANNAVAYEQVYDGSHRFYNSAAAGAAGATVTMQERMRIDSSGNLLVGTTDTTLYNNTSGDGLCYRNGASLDVTAASDNCLILNRNTTDGGIAEFRKDGTIVGTIGVNSSGYPYLVNTQTGGGGVTMGTGSALIPTNNAGAFSDNTKDVGAASVRFDDIYATNGTIQTSDQNEKQQIASLTDAEITAAKAISKLFKTFKWNDSVTEKGDAARTHSGVIAQEVEQAMTDAGLDAGNYAFFISTTWYVDADGNEVDADTAGAITKNRKGIRYPQLLSFVAAATEQRLASIESRLDALEA